MEEYFSYRNDLEPARGRLLISEPFLPDPNFERTVILLCEHNDEGSFGFVMNKASDLVFEDVVDEAPSSQEKLYVGGPVQQDTLHFLHRLGDKIEDGIEIAKGLYWGGNFEQVIAMIDTGQVDSTTFRFFLGYSGWGKGQLDKEIEENSWIVAREPDSKLLFNAEPDELWQVVLKDMGGRFEMFSKYPIDPRMN